MKKLLLTIGAIFTTCALFAADANQMFYVTLLPPSSSTNTTTTGDIFDLSAYKGNGTFIASVGTASASNQMTTVTITHSTNSAFSTSATVTNLQAVAGVMANTVGTTTTNGVLTSQLRVIRRDSQVCQGSCDTILRITLPLLSVLFVAPMKAQ